MFIISKRLPFQSTLNKERRCADLNGVIKGVFEANTYSKSMLNLSAVWPRGLCKTEKKNIKIQTFVFK